MEEVKSILEAILKRLDSMENRTADLEDVMRVVVSKLTRIESKVNVIETKVDNLNKLNQIDEMPARLKSKYGFQESSEKAAM